MFLSDISIRRPVFATMMMVTLVVLGIVAYKRLSLDEYPDVTYPVIIVQTSYPGTSPEVMERQISRPIEQAVNTVQGIYEVSSTSLEGISIVRLQFNLGADCEGRADRTCRRRSRASGGSCRPTSTSRSLGTSIPTTAPSSRSRSRAPSGRSVRSRTWRRDDRHASPGRSRVSAP
jgi:hypothetical protein